MCSSDLTSEQVPTAIFGDGNFPVRNITTTNFPGLNSNDAANAVRLLNDLSASVGGFTTGRVINDSTQKDWNDFVTGDLRRWRHLTQEDWSLFFKDSWNTTQNLTLNIGLRYDKFGVLFDQKGLIARAKGGEKSLYNYMTNGTLTQSLLVGKGSPNPNELFWPNDWNNIGPSVGFSYKVPQFGKTTVIRGGYGLVFNNITNATQGTEITALKQNSIVINNPTYPDPYGGRDPASFVSTAPPNINILNNKLVNSPVHTYSVGYSQQLFADTAINLDGVYQKGTDWPTTENINTRDQRTLVRPLPEWGQIVSTDPIGEWTYKALLVRMEKRLSDRKSTRLNSSH